MLNIKFRDRNTNILVREKTKVTDVIEQVRRRKWTWTGHVIRIRDNQWISGNATKVFSLVFLNLYFYVKL